MGYKKKFSQEKLADDKGLPKAFPFDESKRKRWGMGTFVIPAPAQVDELMRRVRKGKVTAIGLLRKALARRHGVMIACPLTTGIFAWVAAHAAAEAQAEDKRYSTPYWRPLEANGELNPKYPGGIAELERKLTVENHCVVQKGNRFHLVNYEKSLARINF